MVGFVIVVMGSPLRGYNNLAMFSINR